MTPSRLAAARVLMAIERGRTTLAAEVERERQVIADPRDRALFLEIAAGAIRWQAELDACLGGSSRRPVADLTTEVRAILRTGAYQLLHLDRVPAHAAVSESVEAVRKLGQPKAAGFVNAVLRRLAEPNARRRLPARPEDSGNIEAVLQYLSVALSHPRWLVARWLERVGFEATEAWCRFNNLPPTISIRPIAPITAEDLRLRLESIGIQAAPSSAVSSALLLPPGALGRIPTELLSLFRVQDEGSQLVATAAGAETGELILDLCAAPGGKSLVMAEQTGPQGRVIAADLRPARVALLKEQIAESNAHISVLRLDATGELPFQSVFDRVLLDAPCSGLGTLRRDPDLKWSRQETDLTAFATTQLTMLNRAASVVRPGGSLIYATCSSEPEENVVVIERFLAEAPHFRPAPIAIGPGTGELTNARGFLETRPDRHNLDAFFAAKLVRYSSA